MDDFVCNPRVQEKAQEDLDKVIRKETISHTFLEYSYWLCMLYLVCVFVKL
jgi:hypothetical protein